MSQGTVGGVAGAFSSGKDNLSSSIRLSICRVVGQYASLEIIMQVVSSLVSLFLKLQSSI